ncbi:MAG: hypothetical protein WD734_06685 [Dehalococcoidia bacterium]
MPEAHYLQPVPTVLRHAVEDIRNLVERERGGAALLEALRAPAEALLHDPTWIDEASRRAVPGETATWAIYRSQSPDLCIFTMVVMPGEATRVHNHLTDGWVGLVQGAQVERKYRRRDDGRRDGYADLELVAEERLDLGALTPLRHPDEDIHQVLTASDGPSVSLHLLCNDLGTVERQSFDPATHAVTDFVSGYTNVEGHSRISG